MTTLEDLRHETEERFYVEHSFEAWTLDYLNPAWYFTSESGVFLTEEEAREEATRLQSKQGNDMVLYRSRRLPSTTEKRERAEQRQRDLDEMERMTIRPGKIVEVTSGRSKAPKGTTGRVFWKGPNRYSYSPYGPERVGFETKEGEKYFVSETVLTVIQQGLVPA